MIRTLAPVLVALMVLAGIHAWVAYCLAGGVR